MSAHTKTRRTEKVTKKSAKPKLRFKRAMKEKSIPWRDSLKEHIEKYSEPGVMLRGSRHKLELTQKELAESVGISQHHISEMENGKRPIGKEMAKRLAEFLETDYRIFL